MVIGYTRTCNGIVTKLIAIKRLACARRDGGNVDGSKHFMRWIARLAYQLIHFMNIQHNLRAEQRVSINIHEVRNKYYHLSSVMHLLIDIIFSNL